MEKYTKGCDLNSLIIDGWARGYRPHHMVEEASEYGYDISLEYVNTKWSKLDRGLSEYVEVSNALA